MKKQSALKEWQAKVTKVKAEIEEILNNNSMELIAVKTYKNAGKVPQEIDTAIVAECRFVNTNPELQLRILKERKKTIEKENQQIVNNDLKVHKEMKKNLKTILDPNKNEEFTK